MVHIIFPYNINIGGREKPMSSKRNGEGMRKRKFNEVLDE